MCRPGIMNVPNQGARQVFLYDHGRPHWSQGGPLFYDRRVPPPPPPPPAPQMNNFPNHQIQGPSPQWLRGPFIGGPGPNQHPIDGFGLIPWGNQPNHRHNNNRHHQGRYGAGGNNQRNNRILAINGRNHQRHQHNNDHEVRYLCFKCGDYLQNSGESGVHLCDAGGHQAEQRQQNQQHLHNQRQEMNLQNEELQTRLSWDTLARWTRTVLQLAGVATSVFKPHSTGDTLARWTQSFMEEAKVAVSSDVKLSQEDIHKVCLERAEKFLSLYSQLQSEQLSLQQQHDALEEQKQQLELRDSELAQLQAGLEEEKGRLLRQCKTEREEIARKWQELKDEIQRMEEMHTMQKGRIRLDVGGNVFTTSRLTLTRDADSMLAAMFSGRHQVLQEEDGTVFIDRDGTHFRYILNYLRDGGVNQDGLPRDRQVLKELRNEAIYFQLNGLVQTIEKYL
ncbi:BTB/POZ domain-containing protein KCTD10 [Elysia marginata]|uniref:BTB/POZ domain-containing protein KCTD10 n=1 Tax=Elysia marginata TaxID=1093978 RepID=A0AAV4EAE6_9GAST|nr:BTB/POZ domain-containing protein KCTD10 [Elysia marginata]